MNLDLLTVTIERILTAKYGKTVTVRVENAKSIYKETSRAGRSEADKTSESIRPKGLGEGRESLGAKGNRVQER